MLMRCGQQDYYRNVLGLKIPPGVAQVIGQSVHKVAALNLTSKRDKGELMHSDEVMDVAADQTKGIWQNGVMLSQDEKKEGLKKVKAAAVDESVRMSSLHHTELAPKIDPAEIERYFRLELVGFPMDLSGRIDVEEKDGSIRDLKTSKKSPTQGEIDVDDQLTIYSLGKRIVEGFDQDQLTKAFAVANRLSPQKLFVDTLVKTKAAKIVTLETKRNQNHIERIFRIVERAITVLEKGAVMPNPNGWWCSRTWCGYTDRCKFFSGRP